jgi:hypothetical protein
MRSNYIYCRIENEENEILFFLFGHVLLFYINIILFIHENNRYIIEWKTSHKSVLLNHSFIHCLIN